MGPFDGGRPLAGPHFRRYRAECGEFVFRQRRDCPTRAKRKASLKASPRSPRNQQQPRPIANRHTGTVLRDLGSDMRAIGEPRAIVSPLGEAARSLTMIDRLKSTLNRPSFVAGEDFNRP